MSGLSRFAVISGIAFALTVVACIPAKANHLVCKIFDTLQPLSTCQHMCDVTKLADWLNPGPTSQGSLTWDGINYPHNVTERPLKITSCTATESPEFAGACRVTICGPIVDTIKAKRPRNSLKVSTPIPGPHIGPPSPGLLENDQQAIQGRPAAIGSPLGGAGGVGSPTYSRGVR